MLPASNRLTKWLDFLARTACHILVLDLTPLCAITLFSESRMAKLAEEGKKENPQKRGFIGRSNAKSSWAVWSGGLPAMIAINNACLKFDFQTVKVFCSSLQCLVHRTNQFPERLRTWLILIRQLATHLAHWETSLSLHSARQRQFCPVDFIQHAQ